jgi:hypothetical protein
MRSGNPLGDQRQRAIVLALIFEPILANEDGMGVPAPVPDQSRASLQAAGIERTGERRIREGDRNCAVSLRASQQHH